MAPFISEFLLGNLSITLLPALVILAPMYGGGAIVIREATRRTGRGWPTIMLLGLAYAVLEEAFTTQTLFNPDYLHLNLHLLSFAYVPALGIGAWWTLFVLSLHTIWSIGVSIALVESLFPEVEPKPWLGSLGLVLATIIFLFGIGATTVMTLSLENQKGGIFVASIPQFLGATVVTLLLVIAAFTIPPIERPIRTKRAFKPWLIGAISLVTSSGILIVPPNWGWWSAASMLSIEIGMIVFVVRQSNRNDWDARHRLALATGAALAYAWHAFPQASIPEGNGTVDIIGNSIFAAIAIGLIYVAARQVGVARQRDV